MKASFDWNFEISTDLLDFVIVTDMDQSSAMVMVVSINFTKDSFGWEVN